VASDLEGHAARGRLDEARPLVERLQAMARELDRRVDGLSLDGLRGRAEIPDEPDGTAVGLTLRAVEEAIGGRRAGSLRRNGARERRP